MATATATTYNFLIVYSVLPKFYEKMNKRRFFKAPISNKHPGKKSINLISAQGAYSNHSGIHIDNKEQTSFVLYIHLLISTVQHLFFISRTTRNAENFFRN